MAALRGGLTRPSTQDLEDGICYRPCLRSRGLRVFPGLVSFEHGAQDDNELSHDGGCGDLEGLSLADQPLRNIAEVGVRADCSERSHAAAMPNAQSAFRANGEAFPEAANGEAFAGGGKADFGVRPRFAPILVHFPQFRLCDVYKKPGRCVDAAQFSPIVVNSSLPHGCLLTGEWLIAFISGLTLRHTMPFLVSKCEKARRDKIR